MGPRPTRRNESHSRRHPRESGGHLGKMDSRFRGNDVTFDGTKRGTSLWSDRIGPDKQDEIPRFARSDKRR